MRVLQGLRGYDVLPRADAKVYHAKSLMRLWLRMFFGVVFTSLL